MHKAYLLTTVTLTICGCSGSKATPLTPAQQHDRSNLSEPLDAETRVEMENVKIRLDPELVLHVRRLSGKLVPTKKDQAPSFDDRLSYVIDAGAAEISISTASMTRLMNAYVFGEPEAPLKKLKISVKGNQIKQEGTIKKGIGIPFEMTGDMSPTSDGKLRIHPTEVKAAHLPIAGLMKLFGLDVAKIINTKHARAIRVDNNDIILDPAQALPPPKMRGKVTAVWVEDDQIVQLFGTAKKGSSAPSRSNYMAYRGGVLKFGKLTMNDTDLQLIDADPADPFDFSPEHYKDHLVAGYSKTTRSDGLRVYMPDYSKISKERK